MAAVIGALRADLSAGVGKFIADMGRAGDSVGGFTKNLKAAGAAMQRAGAMMSAAITAPLALATAAFGRFEDQMANVATIVDTSVESIEDMGTAVREIARRTPVAMSDIATALYDVRSAGIAAGDALGVVEQSARLGVAGLGTTAEAADLATSAINAFRLSGEDVPRLFDQIFKTVQYGKTTISGLAQGFGAVAGTVAQAKIPLDEYLASVAALTTTGLPAAQAHTQIRAAIAGLTRETEDSKALFDSLNVKTFKELIQRSGGMVEAFKAIIGALGGNDAAIIKLVGSVEAYNAMVQLSGGLNEKFTTTLSAMRDGSNAVDEAFDKKNATFNAAMTRLRNTMESAAIVIGAVLAPAVMSASDALAGLVAWFERIDPALRTTIVAIAGVLGVLGPVMLAMGLTSTAFATLIPLVYNATRAMIGFAASTVAATWPFWLVVGGIAAVTAAVITLTDTWGDVGDAIRGAYERIRQWLVDKLGVDLDSIIEKTQRFFGFFSDQAGGPFVPTGEGSSGGAGGMLPDGTGGGSGAPALSKAEEAELDRIMAKVDPLKAAIEEYWKALHVVQKANGDLDAASKALGAEFVKQMGGVEKLTAVYDKLPPSLQRAYLEQKRLDEQTASTEALEKREQALASLMHELNDRFDPGQVLARQMSDLRELQRQGLLLPGVYEKAAAAYQEAFEDANAAVEDSFRRTDLIVDRIGQSLADWSGWLEDATGQAMRLAQQIAQLAFIDPFLDEFGRSGIIKQFLGGILGGASGMALPSAGPLGVGGDHAGLVGYAKGGTIPRGTWAMVGEEGPEPIFAGDADLQVYPHGTPVGGRTTIQNFHIVTPDADSFRRSKRQVARVGKRDLAIA